MYLDVMFCHDLSSCSVGEWEVYMTESSGFVFYGMEHLLSYIPPSKVSALNIPGLYSSNPVDHRIVVVCFAGTF